MYLPSYATTFCSLHMCVGLPGISHPPHYYYLDHHASIIVEKEEEEKEGGAMMPPGGIPDVPFFLPPQKALIAVLKARKSFLCTLLSNCLIYGR